MKMPLVVCLSLLTIVSAEANRIGGGSVSREGPNGGSVEAQGGHVGRFGAGSVSAEGPNGGTYDASGARAGRYSAGTASATGANGGTYNATRTSNGRYSNTTVNAQGANGGTYNASSSSYNGYRSGYVYTGGVYRPANVTVNTLYVAPVGAYAGMSVMTQPTYVSYPMYATYPVEVAVQVQLKKQGYYGGAIDGTVGPMTQQAIAKYQSQNGLPPTGQINKALLKSLNII